jgi:hypothetical protein
MCPNTATSASRAAEAAADALRDLVHATHPGTTHDGSGLHRPSDVYDVLGVLGSAIADVPQTLEQLVRFLEAEAAAGRVSNDDPSCSITAAVTAARDHATAAAALTSQLAASIGHAHAATSWLAVAPVKRDVT